MITRAVIRNFRCLVDVDLTFEPLTILVGPNASGKSAILAALDTREMRISSNAWRGEKPAQVQIALDDNVLRAGLELETLGPAGGGGFQILHLELERMRSSNQVSESPGLDPNGGNLANAFATLTRSQQNSLVEQLTTLVPMYRDVVVRPSANGYHRLVFQDRWASTLWYEPKQVSDGTMLLLAFLLLQHQTAVVQVVAIEEPERGLHPYLLGELVRMLRNLATGKLGPRAIQVILATHSSELLEFAEPSEVRFISRRDTDGATQVERAPTGSADWANAVKEYQGSLGGLWLSGALGGVPGG